MKRKEKVNEINQLDVLMKRKKERERVNQSRCKMRQLV